MKRRKMMAARGFTLIELVVAVAIVGIVSVVIFALFNTTSQNFLEVDQLADLNDRVRFANEVMRNQLQAAGSQSSPDSLNDSIVAPPLPGAARVAGIYPYNGWQDSRSQLPGAIAVANPHVSFDGLVVAGAYDYPLSFEFAGMDDNGGARIGRIYNNYKGLGKLVRQDPFVENAALANVDTSVMAPNWTTRLIRISDRNGYQQFIQPLTIAGALVNDILGRPYAAVNLPPDGSTFAPKFKSTADGFYGIDDLPEGDTGYDAGLIDFFWFHVVADQASPDIMVLVRDRLCGAGVVAAGAALNPSAVLANTCPNGNLERVVVASYIADFQVWFDCADPVDGAVRNVEWSNGWVPNDHSGALDCMNDSAPNQGLARVGHVRLSMHTKNERTDQSNTQFEDAAGSVCPTPTTCDPIRLESATLRTYDFYPESRGASTVVVMQSDFELVNFVNRNPL